VFAFAVLAAVLQRQRDHLPAAFHLQVLLIAAERPVHEGVLEGVHRVAVDGDDAVAGQQTGCGGRAVGVDGADPRGDHVPPEGEEHEREKQDREYGVEDHAGGHDHHAPTDGLVREGARVVARLDLGRLLIHDDVVLPQHLHVAPEGQCVEAVVRLAVALGGQFLGGVFRTRPESQAFAAAVADQPVEEADGEAIDAHTHPFGG